MKDLIQPLEGYPIPTGEIGVYMEEVRELEQNYREAIETLKQLVLYQMHYNISEYGVSHNRAEAMFEKEISIIEKLTGKTWEDLKNMEGNK